MQITAVMVKELRERTGAGMMECKRALTETDGDMEAAVEQMRKSGMAQADKKAARVAAEGTIAMATSSDGASASIVEVNSETDFVAKGDDFKAFAQAVAEQVLDQNPSDLAALSDLPIHFGDKQTIEVARQEMIGKIGENIQVRRFEKLSSGTGQISTYLHGSRIGVLVEIKGGGAEVGKDIAMHIAASRPVCVAEHDVPAALLEKEKEILMARAQDSGKPANIIEKMVQGRLKKYLSEVTLLGQLFVKDPDQSVSDVLAAAGAEVLRFSRLEVGEGIEKKSENFADEVMAQVKGS
ncbi:MAG: translation elongation factor Ts [Gammaproteobacteria bacterium]